MRTSFHGRIRSDHVAVVQRSEIAAEMGWVDFKKLLLAGNDGDYTGWPKMILMRFCCALSVTTLRQKASDFKIEEHSALILIVVN